MHQSKWSRRLREIQNECVAYVRAEFEYPKYVICIILNEYQIEYWNYFFHQRVYIVVPYNNIFIFLGWETNTQQIILINTLHMKL